MHVPVLFFFLQKGNGFCSEYDICKVLEICFLKPQADVNNRFWKSGAGNTTVRDDEASNITWPEARVSVALEKLAW